MLVGGNDKGTAKRVQVTPRDVSKAHCREMRLQVRWQYLALCSWAIGIGQLARSEDADAGDASEEGGGSENEVVYLPPDNLDPNSFYFAEHFDHADKFAQKWIKSSAKKDGADAGIDQFDGEWSNEAADKNALNGDLGLVLKSKAKHAAISSRFRKPFVFKGNSKPLVVQYEINFQNGQDCGGGYIKLLSHSNALDLNKLNDKTPYTIMFGPDRCGSDSKLHLIFRHVNPKNSSIEEKHVKKLETKERALFEELFKDKRPHLFRLVISPDNSYEIYVDYQVVNHGSLLTDFSPPVNPPAEIDDPNDKKPSDWDEREKIQDPEATKPEDWDENAPKQLPDTSASKPDGWLDDEPDMIPDPDAEKPDDWDEEMDGDWEAPLIDNPECKAAPGCGTWKRPMIDNPAYKGKWYPPMISNPAYKGKWKPRRIENPDYFHDPEPFERMTSIAAVGIELWSMSSDIYFDNILVTSDPKVADTWAAETFDLKLQKLDQNNAGLIRRIISYSNKNPWLYAVYVVVIGLPLVLVITFCCSGSSGADSKKSDPKKTDEVQADDREDEDAAGAEEDAAEVDEESVDQGGEEELDTEEVDPDEEEEDEDEQVEEDSKETAAAPAPRKRRARKD